MARPEVNLAGTVPTPSWTLLLAGLVMVGSLWTSMKARRVTDTEVRLAAHGDTRRRFESTRFARTLVEWIAGLWRGVEALTPQGARRRIDARTAPEPPRTDHPPYDLLRATVNLTVASLLISVGTADQRVSGVLAVIGGWVVTGLLAAAGGFVMASIIYLGEGLGIALAVAAVAFALWRMAVARGSGDDSVA